LHLFSVILRRHTPAADACYYNDYDFYDLTAKKCVETPVRALRQVAFHSKKPFVFVVLECFSEKPASALATAIGMKLVIGKGGKRKRRKRTGKERKKALAKSSFGGKSCTILGYVWIPNGKALPKEPVLMYWVLLVGPGGIWLGFARLGDAS
jgi:hypothetical protein